RRLEAADAGGDSGADIWQGAAAEIVEVKGGGSPEDGFDARDLACEIVGIGTPYRVAERHLYAAAGREALRNLDHRLFDDGFFRPGRREGAGNGACHPAARVPRGCRHGVERVESHGDALTGIFDAVSRARRHDI